MQPRCIFQDNPEDWQKEASCMRDVYSQAVCCIAATAAENGNVGLFIDRDSRFLVPIQIEVNWTFHEWEVLSGIFWIGCHFIPTSSAIDAAPLNRRAWVVQERYLSTGIIHFTQQQLFWECHQCLVSETHPKCVPDHGLRYSPCQPQHNSMALKSSINAARLQRFVMPPGAVKVDMYSEASDAYRAWIGFRSSYSGCNLTKESDVLVALNGVAQDVAEVMGDALVAGLWKRRLLEEMCWYRTKRDLPDDTDEAQKVANWRAPSWSWASVNCSVFSDYLSGKDMAEIQILAVEQKPSGELVHASMTMKCRLIPTLWPNTDRPWRFGPYNVNMVLDQSGPPSAKDSARALNLVILTHHKDRKASDHQLFGLLVAPSLGQVGLYERVGYFSTYDLNGLPELLDVHDNTKETIIKLV